MAKYRLLKPITGKAIVADDACATECGNFIKKYGLDKCATESFDSIDAYAFQVKENNLAWLFDHGYLELDGPTYHIGQRIKIGSYGTGHILAQCDPHMVVAIDLENGNRMIDPVRVGNINHITSSELKKICGSHKVTVIYKKTVARN